MIIFDNRLCCPDIKSNCCFVFRYWINICASVHGSPCSGDVGVCRQTKDGKSTDSIGRASTATGLKKGSKFGQCSWKECTLYFIVLLQFHFCQASFNPIASEWPKLCGVLTNLSAVGLMRWHHISLQGN